MAAEHDSFFSRWSQRKVQVRAGQAPQPDPVPQPKAAELQPTQALAAPVAVPAASTGAAETAPPEPPVPTLEDVAELGRDSDFKPFVARHVPAEVRNAAVKKLFADPHFNVMDGLDIYIDDYSQPNPLSAALMAKMVGAQFLKLVDEPDPEPKSKDQAARADALPQAADTPPEAADAPGDDAPVPSTPIAETEPTHDDHTDLQLQPDHAPERPGPGRGSG
jgi:hypothetical protein